MTSLPETSADRLNDSVAFSNLITDADYAAVELFKGYPDGLLKFAFVSCIISMVIGIPGNVVTIAALASYKRVHNATAIFIMNLSCADLLFCCITPPLAASSFWRRSWVHGKIICFLYPPVRYTLTAVSIFTIMAITINRYIIVIHPRIYRKIYQNRNVALMLAAIWITPLIILLPTIVGKWGRFDLDENNGSCSIIKANNSSPKKLLFITVFGVPTILIIYCYARIYFIVRRATKKSHLQSNPSKSSPDTSGEELRPRDNSTSTVRVTTESSDSSTQIVKDIHMKVISNLKPDLSTEITEMSMNETSDNSDEDIPKPEKRERKTVLKRSMGLIKILLPTRKDKRLGTMILAIMTAFVLCHMPIVLAKVVSQFVTHPVVNIVSHVLFYLSACINPVIYVVMSKEYRKAYKNLFNKCNKYCLW